MSRNHSVGVWEYESHSRARNATSMLGCKLYTSLRFFKKLYPPGKPRDVFVCMKPSRPGMYNIPRLASGDVALPQQQRRTNEKLLGCKQTCGRKNSALAKWEGWSQCVFNQQRAEISHNTGLGEEGAPHTRARISIYTLLR